MKHILLATCCLFVAVLHCCQSVTVSPKLDFVESRENAGPISKSNKGAPKIQGVRVVVDTTSGSKKSVESKSNEDAEEEEDAPVDKGGKKKTVGIRTDITFEISDEDDDNSTRTDRKEQDSSNESGDGGVPVIKGTAGSDTTNGRQNPPGIERRWNTQNIPVFHGTNDDDETAGHNSADNNNNWSNFIPSTARWTTERNYFHLPPPRDHGFRRRFPSSQQPAGVRASNTWTPCVCSSNEPMWKGSNYRRPTSGSYRSISASSSSSSDSLDDKLEKPFGSLSSSEEEYRLK